MATGAEVLNMLCPKVEWTIYGNDYDSIIWNDGIVRITKEEYEAGFAQYDAWKAEQDSVKAAQKTALLDRLGITEDEAKLLLA
jgi:hypothetical protein